MSSPEFSYNPDKDQNSRQGQKLDVKKSPLDIMHEIEDTLHDPLPEPPEGASWIGKKKEDMTPEEVKESWDYLMLVQTAVALRPQIEPDPSHPRYGEYMAAKREYEKWFRLTPEDLWRRFTI